LIISSNRRKFVSIGMATSVCSIVQVKNFPSIQIPKPYIAASGIIENPRPEQRRKLASKDQAQEEEDNGL